MTMTVAVIPTNNVQGDITSCEVDTVAVRVDRNSRSSRSQTTHYQTYDICTKEIIDTYSVPSVNLDIVLLLVLAGLGVLFMFLIGSMGSSRYY